MRRQTSSPASCRMKGWFDAFRADGGPTLYTQNNRTAVHGDLAIIVISVVFLTVLVAFLLIFPGVRSQVSPVPFPASAAR